MVVMVLQKTPAALKGELSRWLFEASPGMYIGHVSAMVRDRLWEKCANNKSAGSVFQAWSTNTEQHFAMRIAGSDKTRVGVNPGSRCQSITRNGLTHTRGSEPAIINQSISVLSSSPLAWG